MKRKILKLSIILIVFSICMFNLLNISYASNSGASLVGTFSGASSGLDSLTTNSIGPVLSVLRIAAIGISIIMITFLGIKYMASAPDEKASIKNQLIALAIGVSLIVIAPRVVDIIKNVSGNVVTYQ